MGGKESKASDNTANVINTVEVLDYKEESAAYPGVHLCHINELGKMQHSPRKSARLNGGEATPITTVSQKPASSGAGTRTRVNITAASIPCPATTVTTVASQPRSTAVTAASSVPEVNQPLALELMERIAALERELEKARSLESALRSQRMDSCYRGEHPQCGHSIATCRILRRDDAEWNPGSIWAKEASGLAYIWRAARGVADLQLCVRAKDEAREAVKALLIHPGNVSAVMEQLRFRFGRPEQLIGSQLNNVREVQPISEHNLAKIIPFATRVSNLAAFLQSAKAEQHLGNPTLMEELVANLPSSKRVDWARHAATIAPFPTVVHFSAWLQEYANVVCTVLDVEGKEPRRRLLHASVDHNECDQQDDRHGGCPICGGQHGILNCREFIGASPQERWSNVKRHRLCFNCLRSGHTARSCYTQGECQINGCRREHHRLLHGADEERSPLQRGGFRRHEGNQQPAVSRRSPARRPSLRDGHRDQERNRQPAVPSNSLERGAPHEAGAPMQRNLSCVDAEGGRLLFRILPFTLYGAGRKVDTYALLDEGSSVTMIDDELRRDLGVQGERRQLNIQWFGVCRCRHRRRDVQGVHRDARLPMKPYSNVVPKLLIGLDHGHLGLPLRTRRFAREGSYAAATELGWVVFGPVSGQPTTPSPRSCLLAVSVDDAMEKMVEDYFDMENFGVKPAPPVAASDDVRAQRILEDTTVKVGRRYQTGLLWKDDHVVLPPSCEMAYRRLVNVEKKMKRNKPLAQEHDRIIKDYVSKGYARRLQPEEVAVRSDRLWYLPHFGVENPNKPGKVRLVFDAAAKVGGTSLNSELDKGPQHYKPSPAVLFHFREGAVGVCGDIKEMFHQVLIRPEDRCSQRFLWRDGDDERDPDVYEMHVMTFGAACSPSAAHYVKTMNALKYRDSDPRAVKAITDYHYVDDYVDSFATESEAISVSTRVKELHKDAGFELSQFSSSSPTVETALGPGRVKSVGWGEAEEKSSDCVGNEAAAARDLEAEDPVGRTTTGGVKQSLCDLAQRDGRRETVPMSVWSSRVVITDLVLWTDSKTVLRWIGSTHRRYKQFVGNRVAEILESSKVSQWRWVPTADNAADDATRSQKGVDLSQESRWLRGPAFLRQPAASWPGPEEGTERVPDAPDEEEMPCEFALVAADDFVIPFQRFSSFSRLVRTTAWVLRFERVFNCPANPSEGGVWERMVQYVKRVLRHTQDTPGLDAELPKEGSTRKQWRIARLLRDRFWRRWVMEYLPTLVRREKWCRRTEPIHQSDMVFVCDPALARREWRKGIVEEIYSEADGVVRRAKVRVNDNGLSRTMMRPVSKLAVLDLREAVLHGVGDVADRMLLSIG
ncbi:uncharacterized protein LOC122625509 [Drosophila teissieri]|uniref:uncharacterized protein LOC122625509 n=1 Tax=Drosophila teissieri TaxID=7243 RepID=UPI001CBA2B70|nr:uncharacterized protein LOC122625509 [Drosophila teissieri]